MPPTRWGHMSTSSVHPGAAAQPRSTPAMRMGTAPLPCAAMRAPTRNTIWFEPPMARADVPNHETVRGCGGGAPDVVVRTMASSCSIKRRLVAALQAYRRLPRGHEPPGRAWTGVHGWAAKDGEY